MNRSTCFAVYVAALLIAAIAVSGGASGGGTATEDISLQARLTDDFGDPLPDGVHTLDLFFYDVDTGGVPIASVLNHQVAVAGGDGVMSTTVPVDPAWFAATPRYLGLTVNDLDDDPTGDELSPRIQITAVPLAIHAMNLPATTIVNVAGGAFSGDVSVEGQLNLADPLGSASNPQIDFTGGYEMYRDDAGAGGNATRFWLNTPNGGEVAIGPRAGADYLGRTLVRSDVVRFDTSFGTSLYLSGQDLGIGTTSPQARLHIQATGDGTEVLRLGTSRPWAYYQVGDGAQSTLVFKSLFGSKQFIIGTNDDRTISRFWSTADETLVSLAQSGGRVAIGHSNPATALDVQGTTKTSILEITGGSDLAEPFPTTAIDHDPPQPGHVVVIDPNDPGALRLTSEPYDSKVAGIVSGAYGLDPGMVMKSEGDPLADGSINVALTGRVWCWCDADANGPIRPGDMLTSSLVPGHAMRATDREQAFGAVIGKAMTPLDGGRDLVLVLVNLQ